MHFAADLYERLPPDPETFRIYRAYNKETFGIDVPAP